MPSLAHVRCNDCDHIKYSHNVIKDTTIKVAVCLNIRSPNFDFIVDKEAIRTCIYHSDYTKNQKVIQ